MQKISLSKSIEWILFGLLILTILWKGGKSLESTWLLALGSGAITFMAWIEEKRRAEPFMLGISATLWCTGLLFLAWTIISYLHSSTRNYGLDEVIRDCSVFLLFLWMARKHATHCIENERDLFAERFMNILAFTAVLACVIGVGIYVFQPVTRFVGTFFDYRFHTDYWPNAWAEFLLLAWAAVAWWAAGALNWRKSILRELVLGFVFGCLLLSYSRGALLAFGGQLVLMFLLQAVRWLRSRALQVNSPRPLRILMLAVVPVCMALLTFVSVNAVRGRYFPVQDVGQKLTFTSAEGDSSKVEREEFWHQAIQLAEQKPFFGWGPYSFRFVQPRLQINILATADHPHNVFLKLAMERGIPAALLFLIGLILIYVPAFLRQLHPDVLGSPLGVESFLLVGTLGVLAHSMIDFNLQFVGIALPFGLSLAILAGIDRRKSTGKVFNRRSARTTEILLAMLILIIFVLEGNFLILSSLGRHAEAQRKPDEALEWYDRSGGQWFSRDMFLSKAQLLLDKKDPDGAGTALADYRQENAEDYRLWKIFAEREIARGNEVAALPLYKKALDLGAKYNDLSVTVAFLKTEVSLKGVEALKSDQAGLNALFLNYQDAILRNAHFIALSPNAEAFSAFATILEQAFPEDLKKYESAKIDVRAAMRSERADPLERKPGFVF